MRFRAALALPFAFWPVAVRAQDDGFSISGSMRARIEAIDGQFRPATDNGAILLLRTDILAEYRRGPIRIGGEVQDARGYFERRHSSTGTTEINALEPVQAYVAADIGKTLQVEAGRFTMDIGSRRLVSRQNFRNSTNAFTGAKLDWHPIAGDGITLFWTMPQTRLPDATDDILSNSPALDREHIGLQFFGGTATKGRIIGKARIEFYAYRLAERDTPGSLSRNRRLWTIGGRLRRPAATGDLDVEIEGAWQTGTTRLTSAMTDTTDHPVAAGFLHASAGYSIDAPWAPRIAIAYDFASGDGRGGRYGRFDTLFGARVFEYGPSSYYGLVSRANLSSPEVRLELKPDRRWDGYLAVRGLWLANARDSFAGSGVRDATGAAGRHAGTQIDGRVRYWLRANRIRLGMGATLLAKGRFLRDAPNAPATGNTRYAFTEISATF